MCCRYYFGDEATEYVLSLTGNADKALSFKTGDVHPSDAAVVIDGRANTLMAENMRWGFPSYLSNNLLINARSETVFEKKTFADSIMERRCIITAQHFYEWNSSKEIVTFTVPDRKVICMAGIYKKFDDGYRFTVLTTAANDSVRKIHDRMPVILGENVLNDWIFDKYAVRDILRSEQPKLSAEQEYRQLSLSDLNLT